jgi:hypothetical protein
MSYPVKGMTATERDRFRVSSCPEIEDDPPGTNPEEGSFARVDDDHNSIETQTNPRTERPRPCP